MAADYLSEGQYVENTIKGHLNTVIMFAEEPCEQIQTPYKMVVSGGLLKNVPRHRALLESFDVVMGRPRVRRVSSHTMEAYHRCASV